MEEIAESDDDRMMPGAAAKIIGVTPKTLASMPGIHPIILPSGHRRYLRSEVLAVAAGRVQ